MNTAEDSQPGPDSIAETARAIQLSPRSIDRLLCWESATEGVTTESAGRVPAAASVRSWLAGDRCWRCGVKMQSANVGQIGQPYPRGVSGQSPVYSRHGRPASSSRSMMVGTHGTGVGRYAPDPSGNGTHEGTMMVSEPFGGLHGASTFTWSHPP